MIGHTCKLVSIAIVLLSVALIGPKLSLGQQGIVGEIIRGLEPIGDSSLIPEADQLDDANMGGLIYDTVDKILTQFGMATEGVGNTGNFSVSSLVDGLTNLLDNLTLAEIEMVQGELQLASQVVQLIQGPVSVLTDGNNGDDGSGSDASFITFLSQFISAFEGAVAGVGASKSGSG